MLGEGEAVVQDQVGVVEENRRGPVVQIDGPEVD